MFDLTDAQQDEIAKYEAAYRDPNYRMSAARRDPAARTLAEIPHRRSYLDVGCGRGEMLVFARQVGFRRVCGVESLRALVRSCPDYEILHSLAWDLPFKDGDFEVVSMFDVIEHLLPGDDERACREIARVASKTVLLTANNLPSIHGGVELHVNKRPYEEWDALFKLWFPGRVEWLKGRRAKHSEMWRIDLGESV